MGHALGAAGVSGSASLALPTPLGRSGDLIGANAGLIDVGIHCDVHLFSADVRASCVRFAAPSPKGVSIN